MRLPDTGTFIKTNDKSENNKLLDLIMLSGDDKNIDDNLIDWEIIMVTPTSIDVDLKF